MKIITDEIITNLPRSLRRMLQEQCDGEWDRVTIDANGSYTVHNNPRVALRVVEAANADPEVQAPVPAPAPPPSQSVAVVPLPAPPRAVTTTPLPTPAKESRREKSPVAALLQDTLGAHAPQCEDTRDYKNGVRIVAATEKVPKGEQALWSSLADNIDWSTFTHLDATVSKMREMLMDGLPRHIPFKYYPDVLALHGIDFELMEAALRDPQRVEVRPETAEKKYPIFAFHRGDMITILGMREPTAPMIIAAYASSKLDPDTTRFYGNSTGGGGKRKEGGLPHTVPKMIKALREKGATVEPDLHSTVTDVTYKGQHLGKVTTTSASRMTVESDYQRMIRKINAIDSRQLASVG